MFSTLVWEIERFYISDEHRSCQDFFLRQLVSIYISAYVLLGLHLSYSYSAQEKSPVHHFVMPLDIVDNTSRVFAEIRLDQILLCAFQKGQYVHLILSLCVLCARWCFQWQQLIIEMLFNGVWAEIISRSAVFKHNSFLLPQKNESPGKCFIGILIKIARCEFAVQERAKYLRL